LGVFPRVCVLATALTYSGLAAGASASPLQIEHKKTGPLRVRLQFVGAGADNHLPEGNSWRFDDCNLGG
jgi:hypothetical protein